MQPSENTVQSPKAVSRYIQDIFELVSLVLSLILSWTLRIVAHEEDKYTDFLSIALKQTKAGPRTTDILYLKVFEWNVVPWN